MFFQRILERKPISDNRKVPVNGYSEDSESVTYDTSIDVGIGDNKDNNNNNQLSTSGEPITSVGVNKMQRRSEVTMAVQLTPLWEYVLRTRRLPETICPSTMYAEFHERLQDPEWQVRQHALRVLVDVLVVMQANADKYSVHFLIDLIKNLGHQAPTVRKGALDCLRVYLSETASPEMVILQILDTGLSQQSSYDERLSCGVLLSLPALMQSILHTSQCHFIVKHILERLVQRLQRQQSQQEIILKVLTKISELLGLQQFECYLEEMKGLALYNHLCKVYGVSNKPDRTEGTNVGAWRALPREHTWRSNISQAAQQAPLPENGKVIMETEIKINDDTLTMRILEAETETEETDSPIMEATELVCRPLASAQSQRERNDAGILQIISDSEVEELPEVLSQNETGFSTPSRGPKRVTFGGEVVKMRTPDSDAAINANTDNSKLDQSRNGTSSLPQNSNKIESLNPQEQPDETKKDSVNDNDKQMNALTLEIPSDNTKPLTRARSAQSPQRSAQSNQSFPNESSVAASNTTNPYASPKRDGSQSPVSAFRSRSRSISPSVSPKVSHKEIEVLHNLQRDSDPSPRFLRRSDSITTDPVTVTPSPTAFSVGSAEPTGVPNNWEDLDIVSYKTLMDLRSGDWRNRLQGVVQLELALRSSANLLLVQPHLDSLLRTLLSSERNFEVAELKRELLVNLISRLPLDNLEERTQQILSGLCRQGNAGANRVCKALMQRLPAGTIVSKLTTPEYLHAKSSKFRDHALQMSIYALMTFPGTCFDINILTVQVTYAALNRKRRVRQAALEVLAVLADISSVDQILQIVADIAAGVESGTVLMSAVKARLSRLQLPIITPDGAVLYIFHKVDQTGLRFGADVDWISQGEGSASPNAIKRRHKHMENKQRLLQESPDAENTTGLNLSFHADNNLHRHSFHSPPEALDMSRTLNDFSQKKSYGTRAIHTNFTDRRGVTQKYSESSMDGRSSDSTTTTCSSGSGSGSFIQLTPCNMGMNRRMVRQNSRFPVMRQHTDFISNFMRNVQRTPYPYSFEDSKYPKGNYVPQKTQKQQVSKKPPNSQQNWTDSANQTQATIKLNDTKKEESKNLTETTYTPNKDITSTAKFNGQPAILLQQIRLLFYTVKGYVWEKARAARQSLIPYNRCLCPCCNCHAKPERRKSMQIDKSTTSTADNVTCQVLESPQQVEKTLVDGQIPDLDFRAKIDREGEPFNVTSETEIAKQNAEGSPLSVKSTSYSQKSTASAKSYSTHSELGKQSVNQSIPRNDVESMSLEQQFGELIVDDIEEETEFQAQEPILKRNESVNSLHSKTESIKTQIEDATPQMSRAQSIKSLVIEEEIESSNSFVVVEELQNELESTAVDTPIKQLMELTVPSETPPMITVSRASSSKKSNPIQDDRIINSRSISLDSIYGARPASKQGSLDTSTSTTDNSSNTGSQLEHSRITPAKVKHSPLKQKSKTTYFLRGQRRVSPVKQAIKMSQTELFPPTMSRFEKPREALLKTFDQLDSTNWEINMTGLKSMVRLIRYHADFLDSHMHMTCIQLTRSVRNLRSQVARAACQAATELFTLKCKSLEQECDDLVCALLHRTADTNKFIRGDATQALESMVDHVQPAKVLNILTTKGAQHLNALVRTTAAKLLFRLVERLGSNRIYAMGRENRDKFFMVGANLLLEGSLETRSYAKSLFRALSEHASYERMLLEVIPPRTYRNVEKTLRNITR